MRLTPVPEGVKTVLAIFDSVGDACRGVTEILAPRDPPGRHRDDRSDHPARRRGLHPRRLPARRGGGAAGRGGRAARRSRAAGDAGARRRAGRPGCATCGWPRTTPSGQAVEGAQAGVRRAGPAGAQLLHPRWRHPAHQASRGARRRSAASPSATRWSSPTSFTPGDGNLHPVVLYDEREPGVIDRVRAAGDAILKLVLGRRRRAFGRTRHRPGEDRLHEGAVQRRGSGRDAHGCATSSTRAASATPGRSSPRPAAASSRARARRKLPLGH